MDVVGPRDEPVVRHAARAGGEHRADYLLRLLTQIRQRIDNRVERYRRVAAVFDTSGNLEYAATFRRLPSLEEEDGRILDEIIDNLQRQFPPRAPE